MELATPIPLGLRANPRARHPNKTSASCFEAARRELRRKAAATGTARGEPKETKSRPRRRSLRAAAGGASGFRRPGILRSPTLALLAEVGERRRARQRVRVDLRLNANGDANEMELSPRSSPRHVDCAKVRQLHEVALHYCL